MQITPSSGSNFGANQQFRHKQFPVVAPSGQAFPVVRVK
jgi:hypothetical protein